MKVYWTTEEGTAKESDYSPLNHEGQASNGFQSDEGRMGRTFYTTEDVYSEEDETFTVRADNASSNGTGAGSCEIEIEDDDGPGAIRTWVVYRPSSGQEGYQTGDRILISQRFTQEVIVQGGEVTLGLAIGQGDEVVRRTATYTGIGTFTTELLFEYFVSGDDLDINGISIPNSEYGGEGSIVTKSGNDAVNTNYRGVTYGGDYKVFGRAFAKNVTISSETSHGDKYRAAESIEVKVQFDRDVVVDGEPAVELLVGEGDDSLVDATYDRGSGSNTLYFKCDVPAGAFDLDGITVKQGYVDSEGTIHGLAADGDVTDEDNAHAVSPYYDALENQSDHKVDGRPYITGISVSSSPSSGVSYRYGDDIDIALQFDQAARLRVFPTSLCG